MVWDVLNRMTGFSDGTTATSYVYRADGMRVAKTNSSVTSRYFYDGQMPTEIAESSNTGTVVTQNATGGRGIERITRGSTVVYPVYDAHGNQVGDISKNGTGYQLNDLRTFDAWGSVRSGNGSGDPKQGYCASLGHLKDDESGLTYMRARYYEPTTGRFVSEDPAGDGQNWYVLCSSNPVNRLDRSGREDDFEALVAAAILWEAHSHDVFGHFSYELENPFLKPALDAFNGCSVDKKWVDILSQRIKYGTAIDALGDISEALGGIDAGAAAIGKLGCQFLTIEAAWQFRNQVALVSCDMAFEDGV